MAKSLIVEVLNRIGHVTERYVVRGNKLTIGRDYSNDVILSDTTISPQHLTLTLDTANSITIQDLQSVNGTYYADHRHVISNASVPSGTKIQIGKTQLRLLTSEHAVTDTVRITTKHPLQKAWQATRGWMMLLMAIGITAGIEFTHFTDDFDTKSLIDTIIATAILILVWAGGWAFAGRLLKHKARFLQQLYATASIFFIMAIIAEIPPLIEYNTHSLIAADAIDYLANAVSFAALLYFNFKYATHLRYKTMAITASTISLGCFTIIALMVYAQTSHFFRADNYSSLLLPPYLKVTPAIEDKQFLQEAEKIFEQ